VSSKYHQKSMGAKAGQNFWFGVNFINIFLNESALHSFSPITVWLRNFLAKEYWRISYSSNVGKIDPRTKWRH
jgi:hypothetical protein